MLDKLIYITTNALKFKMAEQVFRDSGISLERGALETPEIQSFQVEAVARYSAVWASERLNQAVVVSDAGFYIEALGGFPGPFIRFVNTWFSPEDYLNLMQDRPNRRIEIQDCLACCRPGEAPVTFLKRYPGTLATAAGQEGAFDTPIDRLFIPEGYKVPLSEIPVDEMLTHWGRFGLWRELRQYLESR